MAQTDLYLGRGIVSLGGVDLGLVSGLTVLHALQRFDRRTFDTTDHTGGVIHITEVVTSVRVEMVLYEYVQATLNAILRATTGRFFEAAQAEATLAYAGFNRQNACAAVALSVPKFVVEAPGVPLITDGLGEITLSGQVLRTPGASPEWYTLTIS